MEDISIVSGRPPGVDRQADSAFVFLTFSGTRDVKVRDRDTRVRIGLFGHQASRLWQLPGERLTDADKASG